MGQSPNETRYKPSKESSLNGVTEDAFNFPAMSCDDICEILSTWETH